jgi:hypothetical protein
VRGLPAKANTVRWKAHRIFREVEFVAVKQTRIAFIIGQTVYRSANFISVYGYVFFIFEVKII